MRTRCNGINYSKLDDLTLTDIESTSIPHNRGFIASTSGVLTITPRGGSSIDLYAIQGIAYPIDCSSIVSSEVSNISIVDASGAIVATPYFTPSELTNTCLWLDAADATTFTMGAGDLFSQWADKSVVGTNHAIQADGGKQATVGVEQVNGLDATTWNGTASIYNLTNLEITNDHSIYVVGRADNVGYDTIIRGIPVTDETIHFGSGSSNANFCTFYGDNFAWDSVVAQNTPAIDISAAPCIMAGNAPGDGTSIPSVNGVAQDQQICSLNKTGFWIGGASTTQFWKGIICEIVISCGMLTASEQVKLCNYFDRKWNIGL